MNDRARALARVCVCERAFVCACVYDSKLSVPFVFEMLVPLCVSSFLAYYIQLRDANPAMLIFRFLCIFLSTYGSNHSDLFW